MIFKGENGKIEIEILRRAFPNSDDYWDANWLETEIKIEIPGFTARYGANMRIDDLQRFYKELINLETMVANKASFKTLEEGLSMECVANSRGHVLCPVKARNENAAILDFELQADIPTIKHWISEIKSILKTYNLIGSKV